MKQGDWFTLLLGFTGLVHYWEHKEHDMTPDPLTNVVPIAGVVCTEWKTSILGLRVAKY